MFYRVVAECIFVVEAESLQEAEEKWLADPFSFKRISTEQLDLTAPCDEDGEEIKGRSYLQTPGVCDGRG